MAIREKKRSIKTVEGLFPKAPDVKTFFRTLEEDMKKSLKVETRPEVLKIKKPEEYFRIRR
uniref:Uncharacterized protein n=1 Tax=Ignisphaera aggregans TaxID=334771 RepID=A0A7J3JQD7_9CREN